MLIRKCPRCGKYDNALNRLPISRNDDGTFRFEIKYSNNCPNCGSLYKDIRKKYQAIFSFIGISERLKYVESIFLDGHFDSATREAAIVLENVIRDNAGIDGYGTVLVERAFKNNSGNNPLIALNELETKSEQNEQEGIEMMIEGFFKSIRNITLHNSIGHGSFQTFEIICFVDFVIKLIDGESFTKRAHWKKVSTEQQDIIIPKLIDRMKLKAFMGLHSMVAFIERIIRSVL